MGSRSTSQDSLTGWSILLSQVRNWEDGLHVAEQSHEVLDCRGGVFTGLQENWYIVEKKAYTVVRACSDLAYLLEREKGVHIFCGHANLIHIFAPDKTIKPHMRGKLQRWASDGTLLSTLRPRPMCGLFWSRGGAKAERPRRVLS